MSDVWAWRTDGQGTARPRCRGEEAVTRKDAPPFVQSCLQAVRCKGTGREVRTCTCATGNRAYPAGQARPHHRIFASARS